MVQLWARKGVSAIGVEFGTCSLRAVQLRRGAGGWRVHHWVNLEAELTSEEPVGPHAAADVGLAFGPGTFSGRQFVLGVSPPDVEYQLLDVPAAILDQPAAQLRTALQIELDRQMSRPIAESEIAAWPVKPGATGKAAAMVVAAHRGTLESRLQMLGDRGLECRRVDIVPNAMVHLQGAARSAEAGASGSALWGLLDLGFNSCRLYLVHEDRPVYARVLRHGGRDLTVKLAQALHVEFAVAEKYKRVYGVKPTDRGFRSVLGGLTRITESELPGVLYAILRPVFEEMVHEIERSYRFAMGQLPGVQVGLLYLVGGGARLQGLADVLSKRLGVTVCLPTPAGVFGGTTQPDGAAGHPLFKAGNYAVLAPCVGLALKEEAP